MPNPLIRERNGNGNGDGAEYMAPLAQLECVVERVTYHNEENGYAVLKVTMPDAKGGKEDRGRVKDDVITVLGNFTNPTVGESLRCHGAWIKHPQYGSQFKCERYETLRPATAAAIEKYLGSGMVKGIGKEMAKRIVAKFGDKALDVIENTPQKLTKVSGIGEKRVELITSVWEDQKEIRSIMQFLIGHGVTPTYAVKIFKFYKERAIEIVERNPFQLATDIWGIGFKSADKIAQNMGIAPDAPERLEAGLIYVLNDQMESGGHCFLPREELIKKACEILLPQTAPDGDEEADQSLVLRAAAIEASLDALIERGLLVSETIELMGIHDTAIYTPSIHVTEKAVAENVNTILDSKRRGWFKSPTLAETSEIAEGLRGYETLSEEQQAAVRMAVSEPLLILTGGPGTGKTTTTKTIVAAFEKMGKRIQLASPTGRAAKRAAEVTGMEAKTIHRMLAFDPEKKGFKHGPGEPLELDVLIIDESSMLDLSLTHHTLRAVPNGAQVVFVGDVDQLPSVGPGNVLNDLIQSGRVPVARLTQVFRQAAASKIITNAHAINRGKMPDLPGPSEIKNGADCVFLECEEPEDALQKIKGVVAKSLPNLGFKPEEITLLTPMQRGSLGARNLNETLQAVLNPPASHKAEYVRGPITFREGDRVMQRRNNYDKNVFNGDVGMIREINKDDQKLWVEYPEQMVEYDLSETDELGHAMSLSIHKCLRASERIVTADRGLIPIRDLRPGDCIHTGQDGTRRVKAVVPTGKKPVWRVITRCGYQLDVSAEHPLLIASADSLEPQFKRADELSKGDFACLFRTGNEARTPVLLPKTEPLRGNWRNMPPPSLPVVLDENLSYLLGVIVGDGSYRDKADGMVDITNQDAEVLGRAEAILTGYGLRVCHYQPKGGLARRIYVVSRVFRRWLEQMGLDYCVAPKKRVPPVVFQASSACRAAFLRGLFDTDGSAGKGTCRLVRLVTASPTLAYEVQQLLLSLGIVSVKSRSRLAWCVGVGGTSLQPFSEDVNFTIPYKRERLAALLRLSEARNGKTNFDVIPFGKALVELFADAFRDCKKGFISGRLSLIRNGATRMNYRHLRDLLAFAGATGTEAPSAARRTMENHYLYDVILSVEALPEEDDMCDIEVEDIHSFAAASGFVCHNSQGSEYPACIIVFHNQHYMMLQRNLLYTGLTRAKKLAVFIGTSWAIKRAVSNRHVQPRYTRLAPRLQSMVEDLGRLGLLGQRGEDGTGGANGGSRNGAAPTLPGRLF